MTTEKLTMSAQEAAEALGVSLPILRDLTHREDFPSLRVGRRVLVSRAGLERWVQEQAAKAVM